MTDPRDSFSVSIVSLLAVWPAGGFGAIPMDTRNRSIETEMGELIGTYLERGLVSIAAKR